jgi:hypothetical protein
MFSLLVQSGDADNLRKLFDSIKPMKFSMGRPASFSDDMLVFVSASFPYSDRFADVKADWIEQRKPWAPAVEWNRLRGLASRDLPAVLCCDDVTLETLDGFARLATLADHLNALVHASVIGNVLGLKNLVSPFPVDLGEIVSVGDCRQVPMICAAIPPYLDLRHDERYVGYGCDDLDFNQQILKSGRKLFITRNVRVNHDTVDLKTGASVSRSKGKEEMLSTTQPINNVAFLAKWGMKP